MDATIHSKLKKALVSALVLIIVILTALIFSNLHKKQTAISREQNELIATGTVEAKNVMAAFKIPGKIETLLVNEGSKVEKGQELAKLESRELSARLSQAGGAHEAASAQVRQAADSIPLTSLQVATTVEQAQAKVAQAEVGVNDARQIYKRMESLHQNSVISDKDFDSAKNNYELAQNRLKEAQGALEQALSARLKVQIAQAQYEAALGQSNQAGGAVQEAQAYLDNTHLFAPMAGYVTRKYLEQGEMVNAGTPVLEITDLVHTHVKVFISEKKIGRVQLGQDAEVSVVSFPEKTFRGKVVWINNAGDFAVHKAVSELHEHDIRSFEVKIDVPNPDLILKTGMTARVKILEGEL